MYQDCVDKKLNGIKRKENKRKEEQERQRIAEEYNKKKEQREQARLNELNKVNSNIQAETNTRSETQNIDTNNSGE